MKTLRKKWKRGLTLIELTVAIGMGLTMASMLLMLVNQQLAFLRIFNLQSFLTDEAPMVGMYVGKMAGKADRFRLHASVSDALSGTNPRLDASPVMLMTFRQPDGTMRSAILAFETSGTTRQLNYYMVPTGPSPSLGSAQWSITKKAQDVSFAVENGILRMQLSGTAGEVVTYSGTMQQ